MDFPIFFLCALEGQRKYRMEVQDTVSVFAKNIGRPDISADMECVRSHLDYKPRRMGGDGQIFVIALATTA